MPQQILRCLMFTVVLSCCLGGCQLSADLNPLAMAPPAQAAPLVIPTASPTPTMVTIPLSDYYYKTPLTWSPDGTLLFVPNGPSKAGVVDLYDLSSGALIRTWQAPPDIYEKPRPILSQVVFDPVHERLAAGTWYHNSVWLWQMTDEFPLWLPMPYNVVSSVAFSLDGGRLAAASWDGSVMIWDILSCSRLMPICVSVVNMIQAHQSIIHGVALSPDGQWVATEGGDGTVRLWKVDSGQSWAVFRRDNTALTFQPTVSFSPDGEWLAFKSSEETVRICRVSDGILGREIGQATELSGLFFSPTGALWSNIKQVRQRLLTTDEFAQLKPARPVQSCIEPRPHRLEALNPFHDVLDRSNYYYGISAHTSDFIPIRFPNGDEGLFGTVTLLWRDPGYQFLYRIEDDQYELVDTYRGPNGFGVRVRQFAPVEFIDLFPDESQRGSVVRVNGLTSAGSGLSSESFELFELTDDGIHSLFKGTIADFNSPGGATFRGSFYHYEFADLDSDGIKEIIQIGGTCYGGPRYDPTDFIQTDTSEKLIEKFTQEGRYCAYDVPENECPPINCEESQTVYRFNGTVYEAVP